MVVALVGAAPAGPSHRFPTPQCHVRLLEKESKAPCIINVTFGCLTESKSMCASRRSHSAPHSR